MKTYRYGYFYVLWSKAIGYFFAGLCLLVFLGIPIGLLAERLGEIQISLSTEDAWGFVFVWILSLPMAVVSLLYANLFSPICVTDSDLILRFSLKKITVPWTDLVESKSLWMPGGRITLLRASKRSLPWVYTLYGASFGYIGRCFLINPRILDYRELMKEIQKRAPNLRYK